MLMHEEEHSQSWEHRPERVPGLVTKFKLINDRSFFPILKYDGNILTPNPKVRVRVTPQIFFFFFV